MFFLPFFVLSFLFSALSQEGQLDKKWITGKGTHSLHHRHDITPFITNPLGAICARMQCGVCECLISFCCNFFFISLQVYETNMVFRNS